MTKLTDETLMYYADGMLSPSEARRVEKLLADDPKLQSRLEIFRRTGRGLARALEEDDGLPASRELQDFVLKLYAGAAKRRRFLSRQFGLAAAASAALIAGAVGGWLLHGGLQDGAAAPGGFVRMDGPQIVAAEPLRRALEAAPSGGETVLALPGGAASLRLRIKMTFRNEAKDYCRQYEIAATAPERHAAAACRLDGQWSVQFQAPLPPSGLVRDAIKPAGAGNPAVDAAVGALMEGDPLAPDEEAAIIRKGWEK